MDATLENPMLRFKTFWIALGLMVLFAVFGFAYRSLRAPATEIDDAAAVRRAQTLDEVRAAQEKAITAFGLVHHAPMGGHLSTVTVPDALAAKAVAALKANPPKASDQVIPGSKTFLEQSKKHDPTESEFLKK